MRRAREGGLIVVKAMVLVDREKEEANRILKGKGLR